MHRYSFLTNRFYQNHYVRHNLLVNYLRSTKYSYPGGMIYRITLRVNFQRRDFYIGELPEMAVW